MKHDLLITATLAEFSLAELAEKYIDTALDQYDQEVMTLEDHIKSSENWHFKNFAPTCKTRPANCIADLLDYIELTLKKVEHITA